MTLETTPDEWCRNHGVSVGSDMVDAIWLDGYHDQSVWGYDEGTYSFFAQIWDNTSHADNPDLWLTAPTWQLPHPETLVVPIVEHTGADPLDVIRAMGIAHPSPALKPAAEIFNKYAEIAGHGNGPMTDGAQATADWLLGHTTHAPLSRTRTYATDNPTPAPADVDAERNYATGIVYLTQDPWAVAAETLLVDAIACYSSPTVE